MTTDFHIYQLANNLYKEDSANFAKDQVMDGTISLGMGTLATAVAAMFSSTYQQGMDAGVAHFYSRPEDIKQFWDANGVFRLENGPEKLTIKMGDSEMTIFIDAHVELGKLAARVSEQIWKNFLLGQGDIDKDSIDFDYVLHDPPGSTDFDADLDEIFQFVNSVPGQSANEAVPGTFLAHSVIPGTNYKLEFYGSEDLMKALGFTVIQEAKDRELEMTIVDAHDTSKVFASGVKVRAGDVVQDLLAKGVALDMDAIIGINKIKYNEILGTFKVLSDSEFDRFVHLADNALMLQIGANEKEDMILVLGDMNAKALGITNLEVRSREAAARSLTRLDHSIKKVSTQRSIIGAQINRLEHTMNNLTTASINLTDARSRIKDADIAKEMMDFTKLNIISQAGTSMLAQANMLTNNILTLMT
jgi:flagellin